MVFRIFVIYYYLLFVIIIIIILGPGIIATLSTLLGHKDRVNCVEFINRGNKKKTSKLIYIIN